MICGTEQQQTLVRESWCGLWSQIIDQAQVEKTNNGQLRGIITEMCGNLDECSKYLTCHVCQCYSNFITDNIIQSLCLLTYLLPDSRSKDKMIFWPVCHTLIVKL